MAATRCVIVPMYSMFRHTGILQWHSRTSQGMPTRRVFEGGYAVAEVGLNAVHVLAGFEDG